MKLTRVVAVAVVAAGIGLAVGSLWGGGSSRSEGPSPEPLERENENLRAELAALKRSHEQQVDEVPGAVPGKPPAHPEPAVSDAPIDPGTPADAAPAEPERGPPRFYADDFDGALKRVDWKLIGTNMREMAALIPEVVVALREGGQLPAEKVGKIQQLNGPLLAAALTVQELPGDGVNARFTGPAFMVNAIASTLQAAERPLSEEQAKRLEAAGRSFMSEDEARLRTYDERTWALRKLIEEVELKDRFFAEVYGIVTPEQEAVMRSEVTRDRVRADIFSAALVYPGRVDIVPFTRTEELTSNLTGRVAQAMTLAKPERELAEGIISDWVAGLPGNLVSMETDALDLEGLVKSARVTAWAKEILPLIQDLASRLDLTDDRLKRARALGGVAVGLLGLLRHDK